MEELFNNPELHSVNQRTVKILGKGNLEKGELEMGNLNLILAISRMHAMRSSLVGYLEVGVCLVFLIREDFALFSHKIEKILKCL